MPAATQTNQGIGTAITIEVADSSSNSFKYVTPLSDCGTMSFEITGTYADSSAVPSSVFDTNGLAAGSSGSIIITPATTGNMKVMVKATDSVESKVTDWLCFTL